MLVDGVVGCLVDGVDGAGVVIGRGVGVAAFLASNAWAVCFVYCVAVCVHFLMVAVACCCHCHRRHRVPFCCFGMCWVSLTRSADLLNAAHDKTEFE